MARIRSRETVLFSRKADWEQSIRKHLAHRVAFFYELDEVDPVRFDLIVPLTLEAQKYINGCGNPAIQRKVLCPPDRCIDLCHDKQAFQSFLQQHGFREHSPAINGNFPYPYVLKKKSGAWGNGVMIIDGPERERRHLAELHSDEYFTEEYIGGREEYTAHIIFDGAEIVFLRVLKFTFQEALYVKGMQTRHSAVEEVTQPEVKRLFTAILTAIGYRGICCFNYKITADGLKIFELNPRYGASLTRFVNEAVDACQNTLISATAADRPDSDTLPIKRSA